MNEDKAVQFPAVFAVLMHGITGAGKSSMAEAFKDDLSEALSREVDLVSTSAIRREKNWPPPKVDAPLRKETYGLLLTRFNENLGRGVTTIADATFSRRRWREDAYKVCTTHSVPLCVIHCVCDDEIEMERRFDIRKSTDRRWQDAETANLRNYLTEKRHLEELFADDFPRELDIAFLVYDTYRKRVNAVRLETSVLAGAMFNSLRRLQQERNL